MAQVQIGAGGVDAELDVEGSPFKLLAKVGLGTIMRAAPEVMIRICSSTDSIGYPSFCYSTPHRIRRCWKSINSHMITN